MASDQGNPSAFSCAVGGKKKQTLGEENSFSLCIEIGFGAGDGGEQNQAWRSLSPALSAIGEHPGLVAFRAVWLHMPSQPLFCFVENPGARGLSVQCCSGKASGNLV